jgi:hypothetical protein
MTYAAAEGRQQILDALAVATDELARALALLSEAYEQVDDHAAERLEELLFKPVRAAYGKAKREHAAFAERQGLPGRAFQAAAQVAPAGGARGSIEAAADAAARADAALAELQDSMLPVEVGDVELRAELSQVRELIAGSRARARELLRTLGR